MGSAKVTSMTFTLSNRLASILNKKSQRENSRESTHCDQMQRKQSERPQKSYRGKPKGDTREVIEKVRRDLVTQQIGKLNWLGRRKQKDWEQCKGIRVLGIKLCSLHGYCLK